MRPRFTKIRVDRLQFRGIVEIGLDIGRLRDALVFCNIKVAIDQRDAVRPVQTFIDRPRIATLRYGPDPVGLPVANDDSPALGDTHRAGIIDAGREDLDLEAVRDLDLVNGQIRLGGRQGRWCLGRESLGAGRLRSAHKRPLSRWRIVYDRRRRRVLQRHSGTSSEQERPEHDARQQMQIESRFHDISSRCNDAPLSRFC